MESGFSSPRGGEVFPAGLRVLVVDDDPTWLKILEKMLKKCSYSVTTCGLAREALSLLRERKDGYDIVISDVNMPDMDGFKLLEHVGLEMDLPVIMMSVDGETSRVMKGVQHGACDYLLKPIRMKELRNIWQHVFRKRIHEVNAEILDQIENIQMTRTRSDQSDDAHLLFSEELTSPRKRKEVHKKHDEKEPADPCSMKKARVVWSVDLHQKFVKAVDQIGFDKVGPKKILDLMNVPWLTRENVASHLQKYRLYLSRLQKEADLKPSVGIANNPAAQSRDSSRSLGIQNQIDRHQKNVVNSKYGYSGNNNIILQCMNTTNLECDQKGNVQISIAEPRRALDIEVPGNRGSRNSLSEFGQSFASPKSNLDIATSDSTFATQFSWCSVPVIQMSQENKRPHADDIVSQLQQPVQQLHLKGDNMQPTTAITSRISKTECNIGRALKIESSSDQCSHKANIGSVWSSDHLKPIETKVDSPNHQAMLLPIIHDSFGSKNQGLNWNYVIEYGSAQTNVHLGLSPAATSVENLPFCWVKGECYPGNLGVQSIEFSECCDPGSIAEIPNPLYGELDNDSLYDPADYSILNHGLFIV